MANDFKKNKDSLGGVTLTRKGSKYDRNIRNIKEAAADAIKSRKGTVGRQDYPFFKHSETNNMKGKKK